jgi:hypothetical protein
LPNEAEVVTDFLLDGDSAVGLGSIPSGALFFILKKSYVEESQWTRRYARDQRMSR